MKDLVNKAIIGKKVLDDRLLMQEQCAALKHSMPGFFRKRQLDTQDEYYKSIAKFIIFSEEIVESQNPFNGVIGALMKCHGVLETTLWSSMEEFMEVNQGALCGARSDAGAEYKAVIKQIGLAITCGVREDKPVILDREYRVLDGYQRLQAYQTIHYPFYTVRIDYVNEVDQIGNRKPNGGGLRGG